MTVFSDPIRRALQNNLVKMTRNERRMIELRIKQFRTGVALAIAVLIGSLIAWLHGGNVSTSFAAFGAALGLGGVLGFLFGVPSSGRAPINIKADTATVSTGDQSPTQGGDAKIAPVPTAASAGPGSDATPVPPSIDEGGDVSGATVSSSSAVPLALTGAASAASAAKASDAAKASSDDAPTLTPDHPSNLEQVADWVTKLLLGGGLTQMQRIPPKIWQWAHNVAIGILKEKNPDPMLVAAAQAFAAGLMVYGFILGFFAGFLITKLQLGKEVWE